MGLGHRKPIKKRRSKPRPGRVKGKDMEALRKACFERDGYRCQGNLSYEPGSGFFAGFWYRCGRPVTWESGHMAHVGAKRRHGDSLGNVRTLCPECHNREHAYGPSGVKPCPRKESNADSIHS